MVIYKKPVFYVQKAGFWRVKNRLFIFTMFSCKRLITNDTLEFTGIRRELKVESWPVPRQSEAKNLLGDRRNAGAACPPLEEDVRDQQ
jgi:hypothetical protein